MKVGFVQNNPRFGEVESNLTRIEELLNGQSADLLVLPELCATGYQFTSQKEAKALAEPIADGPSTRAIQKMAQTMNGTIIAGVAELDGEAVYNSAVVIGPNGVQGHYRKVHLFDSELDIFQPGNERLPVFDIGPAKVGIMICFDWRFPESARALALQGADIIAHPSNLVLTHCPQAMITRCLENRVFAITADRVGLEERVADQPLKFMGQSQVVDPNGEILYRASIDEEEMQIVEIDITSARNKRINPRNDIFLDRREDLYTL
jgi:predicted amidohydrolase